MTPAVDIRPPPRRVFDRLRSSRLVSSLVVAAAALAPLVVVDSVIVDDPAMVERVSFQNDSGYDIVIAVSDRESESMRVGVAIQHCVTSFASVIDQGPTWHLAFRAQGEDAGSATVTREELESNDWTFRIPDSAAETVAATGAPAPPRQSCQS